MNPETKLRFTRREKPFLTLALAVSIAGAAVPVQAEGICTLDLAPLAPASVALGVPDRTNHAPEHGLKVDLLPTSATDQGRDAPRFGLELGYGHAAPPLLGATARDTLPTSVSGRSQEHLLKAGVTFNF
jgi:hypothetical protein